MSVPGRGDTWCKVQNLRSRCSDAEYVLREDGAIASAAREATRSVSLALAGAARWELLVVLPPLALAS